MYLFTVNLEKINFGKVFYRFWQGIFGTEMNFNYQKIITVLLFFLNSISQCEMNFPGVFESWHAYSDSNSGGKSENYGYIISDSSVQWSFQLKKNNNHQWPFLGISKSLTMSEKANLNNEDSLVVVLSSNQQIRIVLKLYTTDPTITRPGILLSHRILEYPITVLEEKKRFSLPLTSFRVAEWWKRIYKIPAEDNRLFLDSVSRIDLMINDPSYFDLKDTIIIYDLDLKHKNRTVIVWLPISCLTGALLSIALYKSRRKKSGTKTNGSSKLQPHPVIANPSDWDRILDFIKNNYTDPEINIQKVAHTLGFSDSKLSHIINKKYPGGFRYLVHELRINEGMRLLKESEMNISEIAYKLGYATPNHFNREFKKRTGCSPSIFRKNNKNQGFQGI